MFDNFQQVSRFFANRKQFGMKPGLSRMQQLLQLLDNPQNKLKAVHVAGTNGKGSTVHYLKDALLANDYRVGVFTSPSFHGLTGYIWLDDRSITKTAFMKCLNDMYPAIQTLDKQGNHPTEFEIITALAFVSFASQVDLALIETGMGGREDTTNCINPLFSIITNVARDHMAFLGNTIKEIAAHKAGIIKWMRPVIVGDVEAEAFDVIAHEAQRNHALMYQYARDFWITDADSTADSSSAFVWTDGAISRDVTLTMQGHHQRQNASLAIMALFLLDDKHYPMNWKKALDAMAKTHVAGRFELVQQQPPVIIDGAHNVAGTQSFIETMLAHYPNRNRKLIFAGFKDKELVTMLDQLRPYFSSITLTSFDHPRAISAAALFQAAGRETFMVSENWHDALNQLNEPMSPDTCVFITGSLNFILEVRNYFTQKKRDA
ncbi:folylpolyglutamate synthase/dihydrofolate synthase family protein [Lentibacillus sp. N15]|uniref:bifunctional folylpolyglutamate synthase/dihydrofolate synthase n=1 Tax=Lentibacillus songyuanensis TaxID=3136161 RepID=UPI0031B9CE59